jgi:phosphoesterase RecJ-like protein
MIDNLQFEAALDLMAGAQHIVITTHNKPDGDACGSLVALRDALLAEGKKVEALFLSPVPAWYGFITSEPYIVLPPDRTVDDLIRGPLGQADLVILVDVNSESQLPTVAEALRRLKVPILVIDHHATADGLGTLELVDPSAAATGLLVYEILKYGQWPVTAAMAEALFVATATDTGWFQFSNSDSRVYRDCADLIDAGAQPKRLYDKLYLSFSVPRFQLMVAVLQNMELHFDNQFALLTIRLADFSRYGATSEDTENLINEGHRIGSVRASALLVELEDGRIRCSLRSRTGLDVGALANRYGGGGHRLAAGTFLPGPLAHAHDLILKEFAAVFVSLSLG